MLHHSACTEQITLTVCAAAPAEKTSDAATAMAAENVFFFMRVSFFSTWVSWGCEA
jgi:hypothetical protein